MKIIYMILLGLSILNADLIRDDASNTVSDSQTQLQWQDDITNYSESGAGNSRYWQDSVNYCDTLVLDTYTDWRLPSVTELSSIADNTLNNPAMSEVFVNFYASSFWSSTSRVSETDDAYAVSFSSSSVGSSDKNHNKYSSRCVRTITAP